MKNEQQPETESATDATARNAGRPAGQPADKVRDELIQAARELFLNKEFKAVSVRQIADKARVNQAMVNYYFGSKQGLYLAMVDELLQSLKGELKRLGEKSEAGLAEFNASYCRLLARNPWWPNFMVREVLFSDGEVREAIIHKFSSAFAPELLGAISREQAEGNLRPEMDPKLALISLLGMSVFPFLAGPVIKSVMNLEVDEKFAEKLAQHNTQLFFEGARA